MAPVPDGEWGPNEIVRHLIAVEDEVWRTRLARSPTKTIRTGRGRSPASTPGLDDAPLDEVLAVFAEARAPDRRDGPGARRRRLGAHRDPRHYGVLDVAGLLRLAIDHDAEHLASLSTG